ncbi:DUF4175 family protein [Cerasicoccus frondis]|uniref:DUF4175 family protein n=1 Tax=Cerasicoccus frondis TaxID=490090 RepID=UPI0028527F00|nr:DUF4175 family protein [Cerasicoccus frondis]
MNPLPEFFERLKLQRGALLWLLLIVLAFSFLGAFSLAVLVANALNGIDPWLESSAFKLILSLTVLGLTAYLLALAYAVVRRPSLITLARMVEERHPDLRESLSTAVEIQQRKGGPTNALEAALFQSVEKRSEEINFRTATLPQRLHPLVVIGLVIASFFLSNWARESAIMLKAQYYLADLRAGEQTGLAIEPGNADAPVGTDLDITATINRWRLEAFIDYRVDGQVETYPMSMVGEREFAFTAYALESDFDYRVRTPSLESDWYSVTVFDPPVIDEVEIKVTPPAYTKEEPLAFTQLLDLFAPEDSKVYFRLDTAPGIETWLRVGEEEYPFEGEVQITARETTEYQFRLRNDEGREAVTESYVLEVRPDEPPTVALIEPGRDVQALLDEIVPLDIYSADDYGVSRVEVEISVSGLPRSPIKVFTAPDGNYPLEQTSLPNIELSRLGVEFGDVITYFAKVWDNREPEPQMSRSEIYFIEAVESIDGPEQEQEDSQGGGGGGQSEEDVDLRAIITELKRLIRLGYRADAEVGERRTLGSQELGASLGKVATESNSILAQVGAILGTVDEGRPYEMFLDAIYKMVEAEELANANQPGEATVPMQESMSMLIRLEKYLQALFPPRQQQGASGQGQPSQGQGQGESEEESEGESGMSIAEMQDALEEMNRLADEQAAMNRRFDRSSGMGESERNELQEMQQEIGEEVDKLTNELSRLMQGMDVRDALRGAEGQMEQAAGAARQGDSSRASRAGARARQGLMDAAGLMDERIRKQATAAISGLAQQAEKLSQGQGAAAADSRGAAAGNPDDAQKDALKEQQRGLNDNWDDLRKEMEQLTGELNKVFPEAAEALDKVARQAREQNVDRNMSRAANALLYGRFERASDSQNAAAEGLAEIASQLDAAAGTLPGLSPSELRQLLERVAEARSQLGQEGQGEGEGEGQGEGQSEQASQSGEGQSGEEAQPDSRFGNLGDSISQAGRALQDQSLERLGSELNATKAGEGAGGTSAASVLDATARTLQEYLMREIGEQRMRFQQEGGPPPEKYRELVEEYFRDLAEEPGRQ